MREGPTLDASAFRYEDTSNEQLTNVPDEPDFSEITDISEIVKKNLDHVYVSMIPRISFNQPP